jgi:YVTN family beta-propeller protein
VRYSLGVDLGTTFVAGGISHLGHIEMCSLGDRSVVSPAVVHLRDDGDLVTGDAASRRGVSNPERLISELKRRLADGMPVMLGGTAHAVTDLLAALLRDVVQKVVEHKGEPPQRVALTYPANWGPFRRGQLEKVPHLAGLGNTVVVSEAEATVTHYALSRRLDEGEIVAVYDLGGGTFEASVVRTRLDGVEVLGNPEGIDRLGGIDFDESILAYVNYLSGGALSELDQTDPHHVARLARLRQDCVLVKESLSVDTETVLPVVLPDRQFDVRITRADFEDMVRPQIESTVRALSRTLRSAQVTPDELSAVLLVGGSSRIPLVARMVSDELGRPIAVDAHPKFIVALGAAALARVPAHEPRGRHATAESAWVPPTTLVGASVAAPASAAGSPSTARSSVSLERAVELRRPSQPAPIAPTAAVTAVEPRLPHWWTPAAVAALVTLAAAVAVVTFLVVGRLAAPSEAEATTASRLGADVAAPPAQPDIVPSVPIPSLGNAVAVGATPGYVAVSPNGRLAYIANRDAKIVTVVDTAINRVTATIPVDAGPPQFLTFAPDGRRVYLSIFNQQKTIAAVGVLDTTTNKIVATIPVKTRPFVSAVTSDGRRLYVPNHDSGTISVIDTSNNDVIKDIKVAPNPHWIEFSRDGTRAYTANHESNLVTVLDTRTDTVVAQVPVGTSPHSVAVHPNRPLVANANYDSASVTIIDMNTNTVVSTVPVGKNPQDVTWAPDGRFCYVANVGDGTVSVIDAETYKVTATIPTGHSPTSVAVLPNGRQAYVTNLDDGTLSILNTGG